MLSHRSKQRTLGLLHHPIARSSDPCAAWRLTRAICAMLAAVRSTGTRPAGLLRSRITADVAELAAADVRPSEAPALPWPDTRSSRR